ncbi:Phospholipid/glycerol acyltransferase family protein [Striga hermonthica]|uniref:Phospholipid/glycerol acyltransferase family protein n=1 Tax=Striga hermonthica TaxID=68872 RepID=A0A9N7NK36_STRHE|nr:Phospholipid/glycerol acyltransferase family protein [Striga hermonthica]
MRRVAEVVSRCGEAICHGAGSIASAALGVECSRCRGVTEWSVAARRWMKMVVGRWTECRGDLLAEGAKSVRLRLKDRFRVAAVDYRRSRCMGFSGGGYFSSTVHRWLDRFSEFRHGSLPSASTFYRKKVSKDIDAEDDSVLTRMLQAVAVPVIGNVCHVFMHGLNRIQIFGAEKLEHALLHRPENKPLLTVSNHVAAMDDPLVIASLLPRSMLLDAKGLRWTLCASDRCFKNPVTSAFFKYVKVLPVSRGEGIYQKGMDLAISKLNRGGWVHIFPEGSRSRDGGKTMGAAKRGIGRLVLDADNVPIVVPFVHTGMQEVMPVGAKFPRVGKTVTILVGDPIGFDDLINEEPQKNISRGKLYDAVSARIGNRLQKLKLQVEVLALEQAQLLQKYPPSRLTERAAHLLQSVDWESLGMGSYLSMNENSSSQDTLREREVSQLYPQGSRCVDQCSRVGFSSQGGLVSRVKGYMDSTEPMIFSARGLFTNHRTNAYFFSLHRVSPLKVWNKFWKSMSGGDHFPLDSLLAEA